MAKNPLTFALRQALIFRALRTCHAPGKKVMILTTVTTVHFPLLAPGTPICLCIARKRILVRTGAPRLRFPAYPIHRGRKGLLPPRPPNRAGGFAHTALQSVVSSSGLARLHIGFMKGEKPLRREEGIRPVLMVLQRASKASTLMPSP